MLPDWFNKFWNGGHVPLPATHWEREHYIPIKPFELIQRLSAIQFAEGASSEEQRRQFQLLCQKIIRLIHDQYREHHEQLIRLYDEFDPDVDLRPDTGEQARTDAQNHQRTLDCRKLFSEIADTLHYANYRRLKPSEIEEAINAASHWGVRLRIRFSSFRRLEVYARGDIVAKRWKRDWYRFFKLREVDVPIYQRLVVVFRPKDLQNLPHMLDPECVHVRMFKNIPKDDVDMMLPGTQVKLNWLDTGKIGIPTMWGGVMLVSKLVKSFWLLALLSAVKVLSSFLLVFAIAAASIFYGIKSVFSYSTAKRRYQLNVAQNLYYQNLDNNLGALLRIVDEAEQQEASEAMVAFAAMQNLPHGPTTTLAIDEEAERILRNMTGFDIDFDVEDVLRDLTLMGVVVPEVGGWTSLSVVEALNKFEQ